VIDETSRRLSTSASLSIVKEDATQNNFRKDIIEGGRYDEKTC